VARTYCTHQRRLPKDSYAGIDFLIATAAHVVIDKQTKKYRQDITVGIPIALGGRRRLNAWIPAKTSYSLHLAGL
jgi:hypothetical protein